MLKIKRRDFCSRRQHFIFVYKHSVKNRKLYLWKETCYGTGNLYIDLYFTIFNLVQCMYKQKCVKPRFFNCKITLWWRHCENYAVQLSLMKNRNKNIPSHKAYKKAKKKHKKRPSSASSLEREVLRCGNKQAKTEERHEGPKWKWPTRFYGGGDLGRTTNTTSYMNTFYFHSNTHNDNISKGQSYIP